MQKKIHNHKIRYQFIRNAAFSRFFVNRSFDSAPNRSTILQYRKSYMPFSLRINNLVWSVLIRGAR